MTLRHESLSPHFRLPDQLINQIDSMTPLIRVALFEPMPLLSCALQTLIESRAGIKVVCQANAPDTLLDMVSEWTPDVLVLHPPGGTVPSSFIEELLADQPTLRIVVLTSTHNIKAHRDVLLRGAAGLVQTERDGPTLVRAIECVHAGEVWIERTQMADLLVSVTDGLAHVAPSFESRLKGLSAREREVAELVAQCLRNRDIAQQLFLSETTVRHHLTTIFKKLEVSGRQEIVVQMMQRQKRSK